MTTNANYYPHGTSFTEVVDKERKLREEAEEKVDRRLCRIEERLFIMEKCPNFQSSYPKLIKAFNKFKEEELKMKTFEALKNSK